MSLDKLEPHTKCSRCGKEDCVDQARFSRLLDATRELAEAEAAIKQLNDDIDGYSSTVDDQHEELERLTEALTEQRDKWIRSDNDICQILGKALKLMWYKDDQKNFPGTTEKDGVCTFDYVLEELAIMAAEHIESLEAEILRLTVNTALALRGEKFSIEDVGKTVSKVNGDYKFEGRIVSVFAKCNGVIRLVVQNADGILHIFSENNLEFL